MSSGVKTGLIKYGCCALFVGLICWVYLSLRDVSNLTQQDVLRMIADCLTISGVLLLMAGCMVWVSNEGALDGLGYVVSFAMRSLIPGKRVDRDERYADYVERRREKRIKGYGFLFISGGVVTGLALIFTALFYLV